MGKTMTRATIVWFVGAAVLGAVAGVLHLLRSQIGGAHTGLLLAVGAFGLTVLAAAMLYHGVVVAAGEQDALAGPEPDELEPERHDDGETGGDTAYGSVEPGPAGAEAEPAVLTFRRGRSVREVAPRSPRPPRRDRPA